jgi:hypothetical protein
MNAHQRKKYYRALLRDILAGKGYIRDGITVWKLLDYVARLPDEAQRRMVGKILGLGRQRCMEDGVEANLVNITGALLGAEAATLRRCVGWPRIMSLVDGDNTPLHEAVALYLLHAWEKDIYPKGLHVYRGDRGNFTYKGIPEAMLLPAVNLSPSGGAHCSLWGRGLNP